MSYKKGSPRSQNATSLHNLVVGELQKAPQHFLRELIKEKLRSAGVTEEQEIVTAAENVVAALLVGELPDQIDGPDVTLTFTDDDLKVIQQSVDDLLRSLPDLIHSATNDTAKSLIRTIRRDWNYRSWQVAAELDNFRHRLLLRWGEGLSDLQLLLVLCLEIGEKAYQRYRRSRAKSGHVRTEVLLRLHGRGCQVAYEILALLQSGYADGAFARWRTLHELVIVGLLIEEADEKLARRYLDHEIVEAKRALDMYLKTHAALGYRPPPKLEVARVNKAFSLAVSQYGQEFAEAHGWAATHVGKKRPSFADLEEAAGRASMRSHYKMASYRVHAGVSGMTRQLGALDSYGPTIITGPSNAGLEEPGQSTAMSIVAITSLLVSGSKMDDVISLQVLNEQRERTVNTLLRTARELKRDHASAIRHSVRSERSAES